MKTINRFSSKALVLLMLVGLCFLFVSESRASCPTDIHPTVGESGYMPWASYTRNFRMPGTDCYVTCHFCRRLVNGTYQYYIDDFGPLAGSWGTGCDDLKWKDILTEIRDKLLKEMGNSPCGSGMPLTVSAVFSGLCSKISLVNGYPLCITCSGAYCVKTCESCVSGGFVTLQNCTVATVGTADCDPVTNWPQVTVLSTTSSGSWGYNYDQCYFIGCDDN